MAGAAAWSAGARGQSSLPTIGFLHSASRTPYEEMVAAFHEGLREFDLVEGHNVATEYRWADNRVERLPSLNADLMARQVKVIVVAGLAAPRVAKAATTPAQAILAHYCGSRRPSLVIAVWLNDPKSGWWLVRFKTDFTCQPRPALPLRADECRHFLRCRAI